MQSFDPSNRYGADTVLQQLQSVYGGRYVDFRYELLDVNNAKKADLAGVLTASVSHDSTADIKRTATFSLRDGIDSINYLSDRIKPYWRVQMGDGTFVEWAQGIFLLSSPTKSYAPTGAVTRSVDAYDQTVVLSSDAVADRYSIPQGILFTDALVAISGSIPARSITPSSLRLPVTWDYEAGTSKLTIVNDLLSAMNYRSVWFNEDGVMICEPYVLPSSRSSTYTYATDARSVISGSIDQSLDLFNIPNVWVLVVSDTDQGSFSSRVTNLSASSPTSVPNRGRSIVKFMDGQSAADQATLDKLAAQTAYEDSQVFEMLTFTTAMMPFHQNGDILAVSIDGLGLASVQVEEISWSMDLAVGATMSHQVRRVVSVV